MKICLMLALGLLTSHGIAASPPASAAPTAVAVPTAGPNVPPFQVPGVTPEAGYKPEPVYSAWPHISLFEAERLHTMSAKRHVLFVDARSEVEYKGGHIPRAISVPLGEFDAAYTKNKSKIKAAKTIVVYCHGGGCHLAENTCKRFTEKGHRNVVNFYGGWPTWQQANLPYQKDDKIIYPPVFTPTPAPAPVVKK